VTIGLFEELGIFAISRVVGAGLTCEVLLRYMHTVQM